MFCCQVICVHVYKCRKWHHKWSHSCSVTSSNCLVRRWNDHCCKTECKLFIDAYCTVVQAWWCITKQRRFRAGWDQHHRQMWVQEGIPWPTVPVREGCRVSHIHLQAPDTIRDTWATEAKWVKQVRLVRYMYLVTTLKGVVLTFDPLIIY